MGLKHEDLIIDEKSPFSNCKLDRQKYADVLTSVVENYPSGFVLAINNKWGTGKTTFVKMWQQELINEEYETIYFNAWENDFEDNPLTALVAELKGINPDDKTNLQKVIKSAAKLSKNVAPALVKALLNRYIDSQMFLDALENTVKSAGDIFEKEVEDYAEKKKSITDFRKNLLNYVTKNSQGKPLIFIIDELDRCRPSYAVSLLEQVKHFFSVSNIVFVLSIDKEQLGNAICGVYGSDRIDANEYLRRFIDIEYSIPPPQNGEFINYLYEYFDFDSFFNSPHRSKIYELKNDRRTFITTCKLLLGHSNLRMLEKVLSNTRLALRTLQSSSYLVPAFFVFLIYLKYNHNNFYQDLINKKYSLEIAHESFYKIIMPFMDETNLNLFTEMEALFLIYYQNYISEYRTSKEIFEYDRELGNNKLNVNSKIDDVALLNYLTHEHDVRRTFSLGLNYFTNKIELIDSFKTI